VNTQKIIEQKEREIAALQNDIRVINSLEIGRLYKLREATGHYDNRTDKYIEEEPLETYAICRTFNTESVRFHVVASNNDDYQIRESKFSRSRSDGVSFSYHKIPVPLTRAHKRDLALMITLPHVYPIAEAILKGKSRVKYDK